MGFGGDSAGLRCVPKVGCGPEGKRARMVNEGAFDAIEESCIPPSRTDWRGKGLFVGGCLRAGGRLEEVARPIHPFIRMNG